MKREKMEKLEELFRGKSEEQDMSEDKKQIKMKMLKELMEHARKMMGDRVAGDLEGMKKVSIMAPDKEGLEEGLETAKELLESKQMPIMEEESDEDSEKDEEMEQMDPSPEEVSKSSKEEEDEEEDYSPFMKRKK